MTVPYFRKFSKNDEISETKQPVMDYKQYKTAVGEQIH